MVAIATIRSNNEIIGVRLLDPSSKQVIDVDINDLKYNLKSGKLYLDNLVLRHETLIATNGSIDRLPILESGMLASEPRLTVLNKISDVGYTMVDYKGTILKLTTEDAIKAAKKYGLANGKLVAREGKCFIAPIKGAYTVVPLTKTTDEEHRDLLSKARIVYGDVVEVQHGYVILRKNNRLAVAGRDGKLLTDFKYEKIEIIDERTAIVTEDLLKGKKLYSFLYGKEVSPFSTVHNLLRFCDSKDLFRVVTTNSKCYICNYKGEIVSEAYSEIQCPYSVNYAIGHIKNNKKSLLHIITPYGKIIGYYEELQWLPGNKYAVASNTIDNGNPQLFRTKILDNNGYPIINETFNFVEPLNRDGTLKVGKILGNKTKYAIVLVDALKRTNKIDFKYDYVHLDEMDGLIHIIKDEKHGIVSASGKEIIQPMYENVVRLENNIFAVKLNGQYKIKTIKREG